MSDPITIGHDYHYQAIGEIATCEQFPVDRVSDDDATYARGIHCGTMHLTPSD
ncbi:hypothetical protein [[Mycobacterium] fortunisiensis]|uniref:hypothetical protein n=1 Tax=[Mycobacterium] fortunisiensis TaxID=2600579 RepID=UPI001C264F43|nr:hypothetical protein [[Mycobacterium] fortunisiensis]